MKFLYPLNLTKNELQNAVIQNLATAPTSPKLGQIYFDTNENDFRVYNGTSWVSAIESGISLNNEVGDITLSGGDKIGLVKSGKTFTINHDTTAVDNLTPTNRTYISGLVFDEYGHITSYTTGTETVLNTDTDTTYSIKASAETGGAKIDLDAGGDGSGTDSVAIKGSGATTVARTDASTITISSTDTNTTYDGGSGITLDGTTFSLTGDSFNSSGDYADLRARSTTWADVGGGTVGLLNTNASTTQFLRGDGTWVVPTNTTYTAGAKLTLSGTTFNHDDTTRTDGTDIADTASFGGTIEVLNSIVSDKTGHITAANTKTITMPTETTLSLDITGSGNFLSAHSVNDHEISLTKTNTTTDTITVGEMIVSDTGAGNGNLTVAGNLTVNGTTTTVNTEELLIEDNVIEINSNQTGIPAGVLVSGLEINRGSEINYQFVFVEENKDFRIGKIGDLQPALTRDEAENLGDEEILTWDSANKRAISNAPQELGITRKYTETISSIATNGTYTITHNLNTQDVNVTLKDAITNEIVYTDVSTTGSNTIEVSFGEINGIASIRVIVIG